MLALQLGPGYIVLIIPGRPGPRREILLQLAFGELNYSQESERKHCTLFLGMIWKKKKWRRPEDFKEKFQGSKIYLCFVVLKPRNMTLNTKVTLALRMKGCNSRTFAIKM